jgi:hypothetical protein
VFRRRGIAAEDGKGRPFEHRFQASKHSSGVDHFTSGSPSLSRRSSRAAKSMKMSMSARV